MALICCFMSLYYGEQAGVVAHQIPNQDGPVFSPQLGCHVVSLSKTINTPG